MDFFIVLILALLVGVSGAIYFRIFRAIYVQNGGKVVANQFTRADGYMALGCMTIFALQCIQNIQASSSASSAALVRISARSASLRVVKKLFRETAASTT